MSPPEHDSLHELAAAYALGALSQEETRRFESFLAGSPETQREVAEYRDVATLLALAGPEATPGDELRERVLASLARPKVRDARPGGGPLLWALAASVLVAAGLGAGLVSIQSDLGRLRERFDSTSAALAARDATLGALLTPGVEMFQLTASGDPDPGIQLFWDRNRNRALIHAFRLRPAPEGRAYQLWFIQDGKPIPSVTFKPEAGGTARVEGIEVPAGGEISAAAVTLEPESGSAQPTSPILMVGTLKKS